MLALYLMVPLAGVIGWLAARGDVKVSSKKDFLSYRGRYFQGLTYLINEQSDKAVDVFIDLLDVDQDTIDTHLALGHLFRRRGEVGRAIRIHQNIIARPSLNKAQRLEALSQLGQDYLSAGVLDKAEQLFGDVLQYNPKDHKHLRLLLRIYEQSKDWNLSIATAKKLLKGDAPIKINIAHYYCELADIELQQALVVDSAAPRLLKQALQYYPGCVRASMLMAQYHVKKSEYQYALLILERMANQDNPYLSELLPRIETCYRSRNDMSGFINFLKTCAQQQLCLEVMVKLSNYFIEAYSPEEALAFFSDYVQQAPSLLGVRHILQLLPVAENDDMAQYKHLMTDIVDQLLKNKEQYRCVHCGFSGSNLFWLCPSCHYWESIRLQRLSVA